MLAICQCADAGPLESLAVMLRSVGFDVALSNEELRDQLKRLGCDTVLSPKQLTEGMGYDPVDFPEAGPELMAHCALYVDIKAHRNGPKVWKEWPVLKNKTLWYRINGGEPEVTEKGGNEVDLICPVLTPNRWYLENDSWEDMAYSCWPPFNRVKDYENPRPHDTQPRKTFGYAPAICLIHNLKGWGHADIAMRIPRNQVNFYGADSPAGLLQHREVPRYLANALAMVHLKSNDCPGYSLYEAMAAACPLILSRRMIWRMRMDEMFIENENCLCFDAPGHQARTEAETDYCATEIKDALEQLRDPTENRRIGEAGRRRLLALQWNPTLDKEGFQSWLVRRGLLCG